MGSSNLCFQIPIVRNGQDVQRPMADVADVQHPEHPQHPQWVSAAQLEPTPPQKSTNHGIWKIGPSHNKAEILLDRNESK